MFASELPGLRTEHFCLRRIGDHPLPPQNKKNEIMPFAATWLNLEMIILSEVSETKKNVI